MTQFISNLIGNDYVATLIMSFIPLIELKGGIVFAWDLMYPLWAFLLAYAGSTLVFFPIFFLLKPILNALKKVKFFNKFANKVESYFQSKADETLKKQDGKKRMSPTMKKMLGVFIFVAIPLPMTGVWTGTAIAVFLGLKFKEAVGPILVGNLIAGGLICALSMLCNLIGVKLDYVLYALLALALIFLIVLIIKLLKQKPKTQETLDSQNDNSAEEK